MSGKAVFAQIVVSALAGAGAAIILLRLLLPGPEPVSAVRPRPVIPEPAVLPVSGDAAALQSMFGVAIRRGMPAVVLITAQKRVGVVNPYEWYDRRVDIREIPSGQGSGFFIREDGYILTNFHVVRNQDSFWVTTHDGREFRAEVAGIDPPTDLALLKIDAKESFPTLAFADLSTLEIGNWAIAIGAPFSLSRTVTAGIVSNTSRSGVGVNLFESYIQTDASINPGNSGGPLLNLCGEVIGVNDFILSPTGGNIGLSFAISADLAARVAKELIENGRVERPWLGVILASLDRDQRRRLGLESGGVVVARVYRNSPAVGKLQPGDVILEADGRTMHTPPELQALVYGTEAGKVIRLKIRRNGRETTEAVEPGKSPKAWFNRDWNAQQGVLPVHL